MAVELVLFVILLLGFFLYYRIVYSPHRVLKRGGIASPPARFFYGNYKERRSMGTMKFLEELHKKYGPTAGYYLGATPFISTTDSELIKMVTIKDFNSNFTNRQRFPELMRKKTTTRRSLLQSRDGTWRSARQTVSPSFSASKMKAMVPLMSESVQTLVEVFSAVADSERTLEILRTFGQFTLETLMATAFGRKLDVQKGDSDDLVMVISEFLGRDTGGGRGSTSSRVSLDLILVILSNFPWLEYYFRHRSQDSRRQKNYCLLTQLSLEIIRERRKETQPGQYKDLLQHMLDTRKVGEEDKEGSSSGMDDAEIASHSIVFFLAGYETTSHALTFISYLLASHPHVQDKLQQEIDNYYLQQQHSTLYQAAMDLEYLDMVIQESLRLYPPAFNINRESAQDFCYKGMTIPAGGVVLVPIFLVHKDPHHWKDPETFDPSRFTAEERAKRPPTCHLPFGYGPRNCIGMRFALLETKIAIIELMRRFSFVKTQDTEDPLELEVGITMRPKNGIYLKIVSRHQ